MVNFRFCSRSSEGAPAVTPKLLPQAGVLVIELRPVSWPGSTRHPP